MAFNYIPAYAGNYTKNRAAYGSRISEITVHHTAGVIDTFDLGNLWQRVGRNGSSHYGVCEGDIGQYVLEEDIAWTNSNWAANCRAVTIETCNSGGAPNWPVSNTTLATLISLVADIAKRNNLGTLVVGKNLTMHYMYTATACPGPYLKSKMQYIADEANKINAGSVAPSPTPTPTPDYDFKYRLYKSEYAFSDPGTALTKFEELKDLGRAEYILTSIGDGKWRIAGVKMASVNLDLILENMADDCIICGSDMSKYRIYKVTSANESMPAALNNFIPTAKTAPNEVVLTTMGGDNKVRVGQVISAFESLESAMGQMSVDMILC